ncbi:glycosyltransferase family 2 protein [bacterium]|nr:glycosyltransferase family 2 protein [bacterium]
MAVLSAIVITKNEAEHIAECLDSLSFVDEIVVVDSHSVDGTEKIAKRFTDKVYIIMWNGYAKAKQYALEKSTGEWILWLDADERIPPRLAEEIGEVIRENNSFSGYRMPRKAFFLGRWIRHGGWYPGYVVRLFKKEKGRFGDERVHERLILDGSIGTLKSPLIHYTDQSIEHYYDKLNRYTSLAALDLQERGKRVTALGMLFRSIHMFVRMYVLRAGFLDGMEGFLLAVFSANYVFTKYAKLWKLGIKNSI